MSRTKFNIIIVIIAVISIAIAFVPVYQDKISLALTAIGSLGAVAALCIAYKFFVTYSAPIDIQKKRFELVDKALAFFITKRFFVITETGHTYFAYFTKQRLEFCTKGLREENLDSCAAIISRDLFEYLIEFQSQREHHYFPHPLKILILSNLPQSLTMSTSNDYQGKIRLTCSYEANIYGSAAITDDLVNIADFINCMNTIRTAMIDYLNDGVPSKHRIIDEKI